MASSSNTRDKEGDGATFFGEKSPTEMRDLERNAARATPKQMAKAAYYLQLAFDGQYYAWFGGWALKLRGSRRETTDLDLLVLAEDISQVRATLSPHNWAILHFYELIGSIQERMFVDIGESGQVVGVDIVLSGKLNTPVLGEEGSFELIQPAFKTPQGRQVSVISLDWQVQGKLLAWVSRRKNSDFEDLMFLCLSYGEKIREWSENLDIDHRSLFYDIYRVEVETEEEHKNMRTVLSL